MSSFEQRENDPCVAPPSPWPPCSQDPNKPNVASTIFRTVQDLTGGRYYFESTYAPNVVWIDYGKLDFGKGKGERELQVEKKIFSLSGNVTHLLQPAKPFVFGVNKHES